MEREGSIDMERLNLCDASNAVSSMQALRMQLTDDLDDIENRIHELAQSSSITSDIGIREMQVYYVTRAALYSALASINEVLGWVGLMAAKDAEGNVASIVQSLPIVPVFSIH